MVERLLMASVTAVLLATSTATAQQTIDTRSKGPVSAFGGRVVWSKKAPETGKYRLRTLYAGDVATVPVRGRKDQPFDVDLGPGPSGAVTAVYSRCEGVDRRLEQETPKGPVTVERGCRLYMYDFTRAIETRLRSANEAGASQFNPSVWRDRIVFARRYERRRGAARLQVDLYASPLTGERSSRRLRGGAQGVFYRDRELGLEGGPGPLRIDLRGNTAASAWYYHSAADPGYAASYIHLTTLGGKSRSINETHEGFVDSPFLEGKHLYYLEEIVEGASPIYRGLNQRDLVTGVTRVAAAYYESVAATEGRFFASADGAIVEVTFDFP
jgi:hypothetical protein